MPPADDAAAAANDAEQDQEVENEIEEENSEEEVAEEEEEEPASPVGRKRGRKAPVKKAPAKKPTPRKPRGGRKAAQGLDRPWSPPSQAYVRTPGLKFEGLALDDVPLPAVDWTNDWPKDANGQLLTEGPELTSWFLTGIAMNASTAVAKLNVDDNHTALQHGIQIRTGRGGPVPAKLELTRASNADAAFHQLFGEEAEKACKPCIKRLGPFVGCHVIEGACGNCRWNSSNARCTLGKPENDDNNVNTPKSAKAGKKRSAPDDLTAAFSKCPPKVLRRVGKALIQLAGDDSD